MQKRRLDRVNYRIYVIIIISIFFLMISVGYSALHQKLNIYGKSTIVPQNNYIYEKGNSIYTWEVLSSNKQYSAKYTKYDVKLSIVNLDDDISSYEIAFDVPEGYDDLLSSIDGNIDKKYENGRVILYVSDVYFAKGSRLEIKMQLTVIGELNIENLTLNGKLAVNNS